MEIVKIELMIESEEGQIFLCRTGYKENLITEIADTVNELEEKIKMTLSRI
jgi:hypothetical protein